MVSVKHSPAGSVLDGDVPSFVAKLTQTRECPLRAESARVPDVDRNAIQGFSSATAPVNPTEDGGTIPKIPPIFGVVSGPHLNFHYRMRQSRVRKLFCICFLAVKIENPNII
jgi:hypothetical protein